MGHYTAGHYALYTTELDAGPSWSRAAAGVPVAGEVTRGSVALATAAVGTNSVITVLS